MPFEFSKRSVIGKMLKAFNTLLKPMESHLKEMNIFLLDFKEFLLKKALALYFRCKFLLPLFASIHYSFWQVFFGQRYISAILILITVVTALYGVGLWFSEKMYSLLTMSY